MAYSRGYPDGQRMGRKEMIGEISRIISALKVLVTADIEAGYGPASDDVARSVRGVIEAGAVGVNLEDGTNDPEDPRFATQTQAERVAAAREEADHASIPFVLNARTDIYLAQVG